MKALVVVDYQVDLPDKQTIKDLWQMMPYYHTTSLKDSEKLFEYDAITTDISFLVQVFRRRAR